MILPNYLLPEVKKFCKMQGISIVKNKIPEKHIKDIKDFVGNRLNIDRQITRKKEWFDNLKTKNILKNIIPQLKVTESPIEEYLLNALVNEGLSKHLRTQFEIGSKRVDFAFPIARLVVEADGKEYHRANQDQLERDQKRDKYLARKGWRVLRIEGLAIRRNIGLCIKKIKEQLKPYLSTKNDTAKTIGTKNG